MIASNGHAPKAFRRNAQPHIYVCSKGVRGAAPDKQRAVFAAAEIAEKQSGYLFALLAKTAFMKKSIINCCYLQILCFVEIEKFLLFLC